MVDCSRVEHIWGYDATGKWVEQYKADGLLLFQNYPPVGQRSRTPVEQVGVENGFCRIKQKVVEIAPVEQTPQPQPPKLQPQDITINHLFFLFVVVAVSYNAFNYFRGRKIQLEEEQEPNQITPWSDPNSPVNGGMVQIYPRSTTSNAQTNAYSGNPFKSMVRPSNASSNEASNGSILTSNDGSNSSISTANGSNEIYADPSDRHDAIVNTFEPEKAEHIRGVVEDRVPNLAHSVMYLLPFDPMVPTQPFEFESFKEVKNATPDACRDTLIKVIWGKSRGNGAGYVAAKSRYDQFLSKCRVSE